MTPAKGPSESVDEAEGVVQSVTERYVMPRMKHAEAECWSLSLATWAGVLAWAVVRRLTRSAGYRA